MAELSKHLPWTQANPLWAAQLNPLLANVLVQGSQLTDIVLTANTPLQLNHLLGKNQTGWIITDQNAFAEIKRTQPFNSSTLTIEANADCIVSIWVY